MPIPYRQEVLRKLVHLSSLWMPTAMLVFPRGAAFLLFGVLCVLNMLVEYGCWKKVPGTGWYAKLFSKMLRGDGVRFRFSGSPPFLGAAAVTVLCFPRPAAVIAFITMILADTAAALIGRKFGKHRFFNGKSAEGSLAFLLTGGAVVLTGGLVFGLSWTVILCGFAGVSAAMVAELFNEQLHFDDNFSIPLITGFAMMLAM